MIRPKTIICDIDGCILRHQGDLSSALMNQSLLLRGVQAKFNEWDTQGYHIVLFTGRRESARKRTEKVLHSLGLFWDHLIMGIGSGQRVLINDLKPNDTTPTAVAFNLVRNEGLDSVDIIS